MRAGRLAHRGQSGRAHQQQEPAGARRQRRTGAQARGLALQRCQSAGARLPCVQPQPLLGSVQTRPAARLRRYAASHCGLPSRVGLGCVALLHDTTGGMGLVLMQSSKAAHTQRTGRPDSPTAASVASHLPLHGGALMASCCRAAAAELCLLCSCIAEATTVSELCVAPPASRAAQPSGAPAPAAHELTQAAAVRPAQQGPASSLGTLCVSAMGAALLGNRQARHAQSPGCSCQCQLQAARRQQAPPAGSGSVGPGLRSEAAAPAGSCIQRLLCPGEVHVLAAGPGTPALPGARSQVWLRRAHKLPRVLLAQGHVWNRAAPSA